MDMDDEYPEGVDRHEIDFLGCSADTAVSLSANRVSALVAEENTVKVRVLGRYRVVHDGEPYTGGDTLTVPESTAAEWERGRFVERVKAVRKR